MTAAHTPPVFSNEDLYAGMHAAWRKGHLRHSLFFAEVLRRRLTEVPGERLRHWQTRVPIIAEIEKVARAQMEEIRKEQSNG